MMAKHFVDDTRCLFEIGGKMIDVLKMKEEEQLSMPMLQRALADKSVEPYLCETLHDAYEEYEASDVKADSARAHAALQTIALLAYTTTDKERATVMSRDMNYNTAEQSFSALMHAMVMNRGK